MLSKLGLRKAIQIKPIYNLYNQKINLKLPNLNINNFEIALITPQQQIRYYARKTSRTHIEVEDRRDTVGTTSLQEKKETKQEDQEKLQEFMNEQQNYEETQENALTPDARAFLAKVYGTMMGGFGMAAIGAVIAAAAPVLTMVGFIGSFVGIIALFFVKSPLARQNVFMATTAMLGMTLTPLLAASAPGVIFAAGLGTSAIFAGFTIAALKSKRASMLKMGGILFGVLISLVVCSLAQIFLPMFGVVNPAILGALSNINLYVGLGLFSLFVGYDTQRIIEDYHAGNRDHVGPALNMFLNLFNIFVRLLAIFRND